MNGLTAKDPQAILILEKGMIKNKISCPRIDIGAIFVYSWGHEQTNVQAFEVVRRTSKYLHLHEIETKEIQYTYITMTGKVVPLPGKFKGEGFKKTIKIHGEIKMDHGYAYLWDGKRSYEFSTYG